VLEYIFLSNYKTTFLRKSGFFVYSCSNALAFLALESYSHITPSNLVMKFSQKLEGKCLKFTDQLRKDADAIWEASFNHPFVTGIADVEDE
jgi:hypothetical protein